MARKSATKLESYKPERGEYKVKSDSLILEKVQQAQTMAKGIRALGDQLDSEYGFNTNTMDFMVDLFQGKHELGIPKDKRYVNFDAKSAKPPDVIFRVMGMLLAKPRIEYIAPMGSQKDRDNGDSIEAHLNVYAPWQFRKYQTRWDIQSLFWQLLVGRGYLQQSYLPNYWDKNARSRQDGEKLAASDKPEEIDRKNGLYNARVAGYKGYMGAPFFVESLDPRIVFPIMTPMGPKGYVKKYTVQRFDLLDSFERVGKQLTLNRPGTKVTDIKELTQPAGLELPRQSDSTGANNALDYYEYIDDTMIYYVVADKVVHKYQHDGAVQIFPAYGLQTGFKEYHLAAVGLLWAVRNEMPQLDFMRTLWVQKAYLDVFPQLFAQLGDSDNPLTDEKGNPISWEIEPMTVKQIRGQLVNALKDATSGMDFRAVVEMMAGDIDLATISGLARGIAGAQQPGYSINQLSQAMRTLWKPIIESRELQLSSMYEHYVCTVKDRIGEDVTLFGEQEDEESGRSVGDYFTLDPEDVEPFFRIEAHLDPELPIDTQGNMMTWAQLYERGDVTYEDFVRQGLGKTNPIAYRRKADKDVARRMWFPKAVEDAQALGRVELTNDIVKARGLDKMNSIANIDVQALKVARQGQAPPDAAAAAGGGAPAPQAPAGPPGAPGGGPQVAPGTAGQTGGEIAPHVGVAGANPNDAAPAFRGGS